MTTKIAHCYVDKYGKPYGINSESPSTKPTHVIEYTLKPINNAERVKKYDGI